MKFEVNSAIPLSHYIPEQSALQETLFLPNSSEPFHLTSPTNGYLQTPVATAFVFIIGIISTNMTLRGEQSLPNPKSLSIHNAHTHSQPEKRTRETDLLGGSSVHARLLLLRPAALPPAAPHTSASNGHASTLRRIAAQLPQSQKLPEARSLYILWR